LVRLDHVLVPPELPADSWRGSRLPPALIALVLPDGQRLQRFHKDVFKIHFLVTVIAPIISVAGFVWALYTFGLNRLPSVGDSTGYEGYTPAALARRPAFEPWWPQMFAGILFAYAAGLERFCGPAVILIKRAQVEVNKAVHIGHELGLVGIEQACGSQEMTQCFPVVPGVVFADAGLAGEIRPRIGLLRQSKAWPYSLAASEYRSFANKFSARASS
jgi:hypothetical protein